jgi:hypothetical protein
MFLKCCEIRSNDAPIDATGARLRYRRDQVEFRWGEIFGDDMAATAMIDGLIHHSEILSPKGDSYRLRGKDLDARIGAKSAEIG